MRRLRLIRSLSLSLALLVLGTGAARAQPAPAAPPWEQWFAALNAGDVTGVMALMRAEVDEGGVPVPRCAGGCVGMDVMAASLAALVADGYQGIIIPASVQFADGIVSFDVLETAGMPPLAIVSHWRMELDGELIAPACEGGCLRSPTARAALIDTSTFPSAALAGAGAPLGPVPGSTPDAVPVLRVAPPETVAASGMAGPTPAGWLLVGFVAGLLVMAVSAGLDGDKHRRRSVPAVRWWGAAGERAPRATHDPTARV